MALIVCKFLGIGQVVLGNGFQYSLCSFKMHGLVLKISWCEVKGHALYMHLCWQISMHVHSHPSLFKCRRVSYNYLVKRQDLWITFRETIIFGSSIWVVVHTEVSVLN